MDKHTILLWLKGLIAAIISGSANSITVMIVDPVAFNLTDQWKKVLAVAGASGLVGAALYLKQSPVPESVTTIETTISKTQSIIVLFLCGCLILSQTACGKDTFAKTFEGSKDFGALTNKAVDTVRTFYEKSAITKEKKNKLADALIKISRGGGRGHEIIFELYERFGVPGKVPAGEWQTVITFFDDELVNPFLLFLEEVANLDPDVADSIRFYVSRAKDVIKILAAAIGRRAVTEEKIARVEQRMKSARPSAMKRDPRAQIIIDGVIALVTDATAQIIETSPGVEEKIRLSRENFTRALQNAERLRAEGAF